MSQIVIHLKDIFSLSCTKQRMSYAKNDWVICKQVSFNIYIAPVRILNSDEFPERQSGKLIRSIVMDCIINLLFTLLQIVANDKIISHIEIMILIKADLMGVGGGG